VAHACSTGGKRGRSIARGQVGAAVNEKDAVDASKRGLQGCGLREIADPDFDAVAEKRPSLVGVSHENARAFT
jgi:hypothetical protein